MKCIVCNKKADYINNNNSLCKEHNDRVWDYTLKGTSRNTLTKMRKEYEGEDLSGV